MFISLVPDNDNIAVIQPQLPTPIVTTYHEFVNEVKQLRLSISRVAGSSNKFVGLVMAPSPTSLALVFACEVFKFPQAPSFYVILRGI